MLRILYISPFFSLFPFSIHDAIKKKKKMPSIKRVIDNNNNNDGWIDVGNNDDSGFDRKKNIFAIKREGYSSGINIWKQTEPFLLLQHKTHA